MQPELFDRLRPIGFSAAHAQAFTAANLLHATPARVIEVQRETLTLDDGATIVDARPHPHLVRSLAATGETVAVGDWIAASCDAYGAHWVNALLPPRTRLVRIGADDQRLTIVSNVDLAFLVMGLDADFNPRRVERYLAMVQGAGVGPVIVLTKLDIAGAPEAAIATLRARLPQVIAIEAVNALDASDAGRLASFLTPGQTAVLLGSSGAGKSTLTNTLLGQAVQDTGPVRAADSRGRHTTTARTLHRLPGGACVIDTPGLRGLRVDLDEAQLSASFADIAALAAACRFRNCRHQDEPDCAVRAGTTADRLRNFLKLQREVQRESMTALQRQAQRAQWKASGRAGRERLKIKRA